MKIKYLLLCIFLFTAASVFAQEEGEPVLYYLMEPFDDSLFVKIQNEVFIDPPDPKSEIIVDVRDANNSTVTIKGVMYPFLAFTPETRARIQTYPFKLNLEEDIHYGSVFTRVFEKMRFGKIFGPPSVTQISSGLHYINPFLQLFGGERFGMPLKNDVGFSFGVGTPYSGPLETNMIEANVHLLGFTGGYYSNVDAMILLKKENNHNNIFVKDGLKLSYVIPFGNFFEIGYFIVTKPSSTERRRYQRYDTLGMHAKILDKNYVNWEFRYPFSFLGSTRARFYVARYIGEYHIGYFGREMSLAGSTFDFRFDFMTGSDVRNNQIVAEILVQKIFDSWAFSAFAFGPSIILSKTDRGKFGMTSIFMNLRLKVGTSF